MFIKKEFSHRGHRVRRESNSIDSFLCALSVLCEKYLLFYLIVFLSKDSYDPGNCLSDDVVG